jgi:uncharacterized OsmC-like protein
MAASPDIREYGVEAQSTSTFGRVLCSARNHHFVVDGPVQNGCPGEELTPVELFLSGVASCGVELVQVLARQQELPLQSVHATIRGVVDRANPVRADLTVFNAVHLRFDLRGVGAEQGRQLVEAFKGR